jgi:catechol 2,3-dioxygenase-like lactoylglutathione lyase family enzyme
MHTRLHDMRLHHVGVITGNLEGSINFYTSLGYAASAIYADPMQKARIVLMQRAHEPLVELIAPESPESPAARWIQRIVVGPYHTCYEVDDLEAMMAFLRSHRLFPVIKPVPAVAFNMRRIVFLWGESSGLLELLEALPRG